MHGRIAAHDDTLRYLVFYSMKLGGTGKISLTLTRGNSRPHQRNVAPDLCPLSRLWKELTYCPKVKQACWKVLCRVIAADRETR